MTLNDVIGYPRVAGVSKLLQGRSIFPRAASWYVERLFEEGSRHEGWSWVNVNG